MKKKYIAKKDKLDEVGKLYNVERKKYLGFIKESDRSLRKRIMKEMK